MSALVKGIGGGGASLEELTADATATAGDIVNGKTAYANGELITGTGNFLKCIKGVFNLTEETSTMPVILCNVKPSYAVLVVKESDLSYNNSSSSSNYRTQKIVIDFVNESYFTLTATSAGTNNGNSGFGNSSSFYKYENGEFTFKTTRKFYANKDYHYMLIFE